MIPSARIVPKGRYRFDKLLLLGQFASSPKSAALLANNNDVRINDRRYMAWNEVTVDDINKEYLMTINEDQSFILQPRDFAMGGYTRNPYAKGK